ncbi:hypothetical protein [Halorhodospira halochloris]|nr:hypothetical protein [Halorhodospira halochloris]
MAGEGKSLLLLLEQKFGQEAAEQYRPRVEQADEPTIQRFCLQP